MPRKTLIITIIIILVSAGAAALVWYLIFGPAASPLRPPSGVALPGQTPSKIKQLSSTPVLWAAINASQNKIIWYDQIGQLWSSNIDGSGASLAKQAPVQNFIKSIWSPDGSKNIIALGTSQKDIRFVSIDPALGVSNFLRNNIKSIAFSPDSKKIAYQVIDDSQNLNSLFTSEPGSKKQKTVLPLKLRDVMLNWPQVNLVSFISRPSGLTGGSLWVLNLKTLVFDKLIDELNGLEVLWSPDGNKILFSNTNSDGKNPSLAVMDLKGGVKDLNISATVKKCSWTSDSRNIYCAIPREWPQTAVLPDDYYKDAFSVVDDIEKINIDSGLKDIIVSSVTDALNLAVSQNQDFLLFVTKNNGRLYRLDLK